MYVHTVELLASTALARHHNTVLTAMSGTNPFPNVRDKLSAPSKKSAFEKARLEAEEKRKREEAETAAVYKDFVASFDEGPSEIPSAYGHPGGRGGYGPQRGGFRGPPPSGPGRRHFSGPPGRGGLSGAPLPRKRGLGNAFEGDEEEGGVFGALSDREKRRMKDNNTGLLAYENSGPKRRGEKYGDDSGTSTRRSYPGS
jgi:U2-associated protein SR140